MNRLISILFICFCSGLMSQSMSGFVLDVTNAPVPFANLYIKNTALGTTTDANGRFTYQFTNQGIYTVVVTAVGFKTQEFTISAEDNGEVVKNIWLETDVKQLKEVQIRGKGRDPAYGIIAKAIDQKERWNSQIQTSKTDVYIKAKEVISKKEKKKREKKEKARKRQKKAREASKEKTDEEGKSTKETKKSSRSV